MRFSFNLFIIKDNLWTNEIKEKVVRLFRNNLNQLTEKEMKVLEIISNGKHLFLGPNLHLKFLVKFSIFF